MGLYKYVSAETALKILDGSVRFTQPNAFNDPFELLPEFVLPADTVDHVREFSFCVYSPRRKGIDRSHIKVDAKFRSDIQARKIMAGLRAGVGILCLTRNSESLLMWGHYASEYSGAVIEFEEGHDFFKGLNPVRYKKHRPAYNVTDFYDRIVPISDLCVKSSEWSYEREVRLVRTREELHEAGVDDKGHSILTQEVPLECIRGVYMGERMSVGHQRKIWSLVKDTHVALSLAAVANWDYSFRYETVKWAGQSVGKPSISPRTAHIFKDDPGELGEFARWLIDAHPMSEMVNLPC